MPLKGSGAILAAGCLLTATAFGQARYDAEFLVLKRVFAENEIAALNEPYVGIRTSDGVESGLFPVRATGVSTEPVLRAAERFLALLSQPQTLKTQFGFDDPEWRRWSNVDNGIYIRQGVSLEEMSAAQREAAFDLMRASFSARGMQLSLDIMKTDQTLREINDNDLIYGEEKYFFTVMGIPSATEPWGWQLDGHHLVVNFFVLGDQVVMTPMFLGGEPIVTETGKYAGNAILQNEQNQGLAFMQSLTAAQRAQALLSSEKSEGNLLAQAGRDNLILDFAGVPGSALTGEQKMQLLELIEMYVGNLRDEHAQAKMDQVQLHLDRTYFAWVGPTDTDAVFYYRIHSPVILIEFDHQAPVGMVAPLAVGVPLATGVPTRQHIHTMVRTPNGNDYGKDLLRQHLEQHPH